jgi:hypothetical protein
MRVYISDRVKTKNTEHQQCVEGHGPHQTVRLLLSPDILILSGLRGHFTRL